MHAAIAAAESGARTAVACKSLLGDVCPQGIRITDNAIIPLKERAFDRRDPLARFVRRLRAR